ncbi:3-hydroxyisobutyrate dehydrogenase [Corynebacterium comes]|uniref:3-hydroxyisobutyrate dehydrogenase n=1 Tax=Corynebacterium comes TaxID=2675218 RepID=A0A6B8VRY6_9CORY|nr:3-hydroxyisobutyrate dehydrogenase [Corynebacterium comes]QGU05829.1 3-hydroxyisobutyrate dehydrogenase [Corynebacterium comes]
MKNIAFIGLGSMGGPMAANLVKEGFTVRGFDVTDVAKKMASEAGVEIIDTSVEAAEGADAVITMLPTAGLVASTITELLEKVGNKPRLFIDSSTIGVAEARDNAARVEAAGSVFLDAPVSGGHGGAVDGTLAIMVGGPADAFAEARPLFDAMGDAVTHCGAVGTGQGVKICNNMVLGIHQIALCEAFLMGERIGLDAQTIYDVISHSTGNSWALQEHAPAKGIDKGFPADNDYEGGAPAALIAKDLGFAREALEMTGTHSVLGVPAAQLYADFDASGRGQLDMSAVMLALRERSEG